MLLILRRWLLQTSIPLQKLMQRIHPPESEINYQFVDYVKTHAMVGDVLLSRERWHFTNLFIPGFWSHAAIISDVYPEGGATVIEAVGDGVKKVYLAEWLYKKHFALVLRPMFLDYKQSLEAGDFANAALAAANSGIYDYFFTSGNDAWYCSELVYFALKSANLEGPFTLRKTFGVETVTPQDFENAVAKGKFDVLADSRG